jgi:hypothetical protein
VVARGLGFLSAKKVLYVANVGIDDPAGQGSWAEEVRARAERDGTLWVAVCAQLEEDLLELAPEERPEMLRSLGRERPAIDALAHAAFGILGLHSFYTVGPKEIRAWTIRRGATAREAAVAIHSDIGRGFIRAEVYSVADLLELGSEKAIREAGRLRVEGKDYLVRDDDVLNVLFNV